MRAFAVAAISIVMLALAGCGAIPAPAPATSALPARGTAARSPAKNSSVQPLVADTALSLNHASRPSRGLLAYKAGVDYHAHSGNFTTSSFITQYHLPGIRDTVLAQLQGIADTGATLIFTRIWFVTEPGTTDFGETWRATFPMSDQEQANLRTYAQDVAATVGVNGNRLRLDLCMLWMGAADFTMGTPQTGLGFTPVLGTEYTRRVEVTTDKLLAAVQDIVRPDGIHVVDSVYLIGELMAFYRPNEDWFMLAHYPRFVQAVQAAGLKPSVYFSCNGTQAVMLQTDFIDAEYSILYGRATLWSLYRNLKWMVDHHLYIPERIDFSFYITDPDGADFQKILHKTLDDADAVLPTLGIPTFYGVAETHYFADPVQRRALGQAFVREATRDPRLERVQFWTTPTGNDPAVGFGWPLAIQDYLP